MDEGRKRVLAIVARILVARHLKTADEPEDQVHGRCCGSVGGADHAEIDNVFPCKEQHMAEPTYEELKARVAELEKQKRSGSLQFRVGDKGGVSVYGLGRFPVTLYYEQWVRLLDAAQELRDFLETNKAKLKLKEPQ